MSNTDDAKLLAPFFGNANDDTHCFQATLKMVLKHFRPDENFTWEELDKVTGKLPGRYTWPYVGLGWMSDRGIGVVNIDAFNNHRFVEEGAEYLISEYGKELAEEQIRMSDIAYEQSNARLFTQKVTVEERVPDREDLKRLLATGYLIVCNVNSRALNGRSGYVGHYVLVFHVGGDSIVFHDPGLPPRPNRQVPFSIFEAAWAYPNEKSKNIIAFRSGTDTARAAG